MPAVTARPATRPVCSSISVSGTNTYEFSPQCDVKKPAATSENAESHRCFPQNKNSENAATSAKCSLIPEEKREERRKVKMK